MMDTHTERIQVKMKVAVGVMHPETREHQELPASPQELGERQD